MTGRKVPPKAPPVRGQVHIEDYARPIQAAIAQDQALIADLRQQLNDAEVRLQRNVGKMQLLVQLQADIQPQAAQNGAALEETAPEEGS